MLDIINQDTNKTGIKSILKAFSYPGNFAVFLFRLSSYFYSKGKIGWFLSMLLFRMNILLHNSEIWPTADIGASFAMPHPYGMVIASAKIGKNVKIYQNVTIGRRHDSDHSNKYATIGDNVIIYAGAVIVGKVVIGENSVIGANVVLTDDVPSNTTVTVQKPIYKSIRNENPVS